MLENTRKSLNRQAVTLSPYLDIVIYVSIFLDIFCHDLVTASVLNLPPILLRISTFERKQKAEQRSRLTVSSMLVCN